ncbi:hypothetical protein K493DRAFT_2209 [Basidiobolus meristosporus CBS 931.73]|uniref:Uncharacterized protein n=1 Tax=Basidiobolus meristosporus CBS 931.73 TaxID=1314790 RepID=A0A1Y1WQ34_9FUNG|nr:hypothetical protein K493DRAFT_2209 [Basidiobolus meristosporus CBS 931.73]|eukprot:ORX75408.1 hypothetical protein K493DRAFT_2209 [Basidiobolus meristosporus CBS 931.73]
MTFAMDEEFEMIMELIQCNVPFAFTRWGDGEYFLVSGNSIAPGAQAETVDKWIWREDRIGVLGNTMIESLQNPVGMYFYGLPCPFTWNSALPRYLSLGRNISTSRMSYSMIWMGENYPKLYKFFQSIQTGTTTMKQKVVLLINQSGSDRLEELSKWASHVVFVPDNCAEIFEIPSTRCAWISYAQSIARLHTDTLFMISAGPLSEVLIYYMYQARPFSNQYVDFGSSLDDVGKGENTRGYSPNSKATTRACPFVFGRNVTSQTNFDERYCLLTEPIEANIS